MVITQAEPSASDAAKTLAWSRRHVLAAALTVPVWAASGCSFGRAITAPVPEPIPGPGDPSAAVVVVGAHANAPAPTLTDSDERIVAKVIAAGGQVSVIAVAGAPSIVAEHELPLRPVKGTAAGQKQLVARNLELTRRAIAAQTPVTDGADAWEAVAQAADQIQSQNGRNAIIIVVDSGLNDRGRLNFTSPGMLAADPDDVVAHLKGQLPNLHGITVRLSGIGYATPPQPRLDQVNRNRLTAIWEACLKSSGARVMIDRAPRSGASVDSHGHTVETVPIPAVAAAAPQGCQPREVVFASQSDVSFRPNTDTFRDIARAHQALGPIALWLNSDSTRTAMIRGTTADDGSPQIRQRRLGHQRAGRVADYLQRHGVRPSQLTVKGVGSNFPEYVRPDRDRNGLLPGPAALNRAVRITLADPC